MKGSFESLVQEMYALINSFKTRKSKLLQERDEWMAEREQLRTERGERSSQYHDVLFTVRRLALDSGSSKGWVEEFASMLQLLYDERPVVSVSA